jgi:hypothetical protein
MPTLQQLAGLTELSKTAADLDAAWLDLQQQGLRQLKP